MTETRTGDRLPVSFTRREAALALGKSSSAVDSWIKRALERGEIILLKKGLYLMTQRYLRESDKKILLEFLASRMYAPSYISLEYAMIEHGLLLPSGAHVYEPVTSITKKTGGYFANFLGKFSYKNIKDELFYGFEQRNFGNEIYRMATKSKALFDFLYLRRDLSRRNKKRLKKQLFEELGIQWTHFSEKDFEEFDQFVWKSNSKKMITIWEILKERFDRERMNKEFAAFRSGLLGHD